MNATDTEALAALLNARHEECPGCHLDLSAEQDEIRGWQWVCNNPKCPDSEGAWPVNYIALQRAAAALRLSNL